MILPLDTREALMTERERHFQILEQIWANVPEIAEEEVMQDVAEAVAAARQKIESSS